MLPLLPAPANLPRLPLPSLSLRVDHGRARDVGGQLGHELPVRRPESRCSWRRRVMLRRPRPEVEQRRVGEDYKECKGD